MLAFRVKLSKEDLQEKQRICVTAVFDSKRGDFSKRLVLTMANDLKTPQTAHYDEYLFAEKFIDHNGKELDINSREYSGYEWDLIDSKCNDVGDSQVFDAMLTRCPRTGGYVVDAKTASRPLEPFNRKRHHSNTFNARLLHNEKKAGVRVSTTRDLELQ